MVTIPSSVELGQLRRALQHQAHCRLVGAARASVAVILRQARNDIELLVIRRAAREGDPWSGHMGLPGGHRHISDADDYQTALRETLEEIGLDLSVHAAPLGRLDDVRASAMGKSLDLIISPFVFLVGASPSLELSDEVAETLWMSLTTLASGHHTAWHEVQREGQLRKLPAWNVDGRVIWGLTFGIVSNLLGHFDSGHE